MKKYLGLITSLIILSGCAVSSINVLEQKETAKPFSKLLLIYIDGDYELDFLDSSTYNICVKPYFEDSTNFDLMSKAEKTISNNLAPTKTTIIKSSDLFNSELNSYQDFAHQIDSLGIDGILMVNRSSYSHETISHPGTYDPVNHSATQSWNARGMDAGYHCYLLKSNSYFPIWVAQFALKGKEYSSKSSLRNKMSIELSKSLKDAGYIFR